MGMGLQGGCAGLLCCMELCLSWFDRQQDSWHTTTRPEPALAVQKGTTGPGLPLETVTGLAFLYGSRPTLQRCGAIHTVRIQKVSGALKR